MAGCSRGALVELTGIDHDLSLGIEFHPCPVHGPRCRSFEINPFAVVPAAVAGAFKFVFALHPIGRAAQMGALGVDDENSLGVANHPNSMFLLKSGIHPIAEI